MVTSTTFSLFRFLLLDVVLDIVRFPLWWYSRGLRRVVEWLLAQLRYAEDRLALVVLLKNLGRPMYGDYSREGRVISFVIRVVQLVISFFLFLVWIVFLIAVLVAYAVLLPAVVFLIFFFRPRA